MVQCYKQFISGPPADGSQRVNKDKMKGAEQGEEIYGN